MYGNFGIAAALLDLLAVVFIATHVENSGSLYNSAFHLSR